MKMIFKIARKELQLLFYSPVAWVLLMLLVFQTAFVFVEDYSIFLKGNEYGKGIFGGVSTRLFVMGGVWSVVSEYLYFYIPLLTMGLVSREINTGSIKLLYSSPVTNSQIILGKFFSMVVFALILSVILLTYVIVAGFTVPGFEWKMILVGLLGLFLLTCTYAAVGIFISSLSSYQFVAAIGTFLVLMLLTYIGRWWQEYDIIRDVTYWLSINGRTSTFIMGMICSEDLLYFPMVTALMLSLTIIRLNAVRQKIPFRVTCMKNLGVILLICFLGYLSSRPSLMAYYDATSTKQNTLTKQSQDIVSKLKGGLTITAYNNVLSKSYTRAPWPYFIQQNREIFKNFERFKPELKLKVVYYYDTVTIEDGKNEENWFLTQGKRSPGKSLWERTKERSARMHTDSMLFKHPAEIRKEIDLTGERTFVWKIERENGQWTWLRTYNDLYVFPFESEISAALKKLVVKAPKIGFVQNNNLRSIDDYSMQGYTHVTTEKSFRSSLINQGFLVDKVDLLKEIPDDITVLTLADIRVPFDEQEEKVLETYINRGGNLLVLVEPRRREEMNSLLKKYLGVEIQEGTLVQYYRADTDPDVLYAALSEKAKDLSFRFKAIPYVVMPTASGLNIVENKGFNVTPLLRVDSSGVDGKKNGFIPVWNEIEALDYEENRMICNEDVGEVAKDYCTGVMLSRFVDEKEQKIVVLGDADFISDGELMQTRSSRVNQAFIMAIFSYLSNEEMPIDTRRPSGKDNRVLINRQGYNILYGGYIIAFPLLLFGIGTFLWLRRRGR